MTCLADYHSDCFIWLQHSFYVHIFPFFSQNFNDFLPFRPPFCFCWPLSLASVQLPVFCYFHKLAFSDSDATDGINGSPIQTSLSGVSDQRRRLKFRLDFTGKSLKIQDLPSKILKIQDLENWSSCRQELENSRSCQDFEKNQDLAGKILKIFKILQLTGSQLTTGNSPLLTYCLVEPIFHHVVIFCIIVRQATDFHHITWCRWWPECSRNLVRVAKTKALPLYI